MKLREPLLVRVNKALGKGAKVRGPICHVHGLCHIKSNIHLLLLIDSPSIPNLNLGILYKVKEVDRLGCFGINGTKWALVGSTSGLY